ncbi:MAG: DUF1848 domain-containing protein [Eubacteriales bacterium]|nr:DUF1848 domain-containing protein [Eubacteriales bacterium]
MIVSASRRTDIPAFYTPWLMERLRRGFVDVRNPHNPSQISRVSLLPNDMQGLVLWSKDPSPLLPHLKELTAVGVPYYFQFTLTPYGTELEANLPDKSKLLNVMCSISSQLGKDSVVWRYDPIVLNEQWSMERHLRCFARMCRALAGAVDTCVISFVDLYAKNAAARRSGLLRPISPLEMETLAQGLAASAEACGIRLYACCEAVDLSRFSIFPSRCIDPARLERLGGRPMGSAGGTNQRPRCGCAPSVDIGAYDTCSHGCRYCYATQSSQAVSRNCARHDPQSSLLLGKLGSGETPVPIRTRSTNAVQLNFIDPGGVHD